MRAAAQSLLGEEDADLDLQRALEASQEEGRRLQVLGRTEEEELAEAMRRSAEEGS